MLNKLNRFTKISFDRYSKIDIKKSPALGDFYFMFTIFYTLD